MNEMVFLTRTIDLDIVVDIANVVVEQVDIFLDCHSKHQLAVAEVDVSDCYLDLVHLDSGVAFVEGSIHCCPIQSHFALDLDY